ncbi:nucleolar pre-ribosomal-associated protein 1 [Diutina rugosa]
MTSSSGYQSGELLVEFSKVLEEPRNLPAFIKKGQLPRLLSSWSYFGSTNDHQNFQEMTYKLARLGYMINAVSGKIGDEFHDLHAPMVEQRPQVIQYYRDLMDNYSKYVYRALSNNRFAVINSMLKFLSQAVKFDSICANDLLNSFDFNLAALPKLLVSSSKLGIQPVGKEEVSIRHNFIVFWTSLMGTIGSIHRSDLLIQSHKIMNAFWKHMADSDNEATLQIIFEFINDKILDENSMKRASKCKILNENFMHKIVQLYPRLDKAFADKLTELLTKMATDPKAGLAFAVSPAQLWQNEGGVEMEINKKKFKVFNNLIYVLLTALKPWEQYSQHQLVIEILKRHQIELLGPYMNWMVQNGGGYHDPSLSSWWIGHTLLYTNILQLEIALTGDADSRKLAETIALAPLSKQAFTKCLTSPTPMINQFALNLVMYTLQKLERVLKLEVCPRQELVELTFQNLPDITKILELYNAESVPKVTKLTLLKIMNYYEQLYTVPQAPKAAIFKLATAGINDKQTSNFDFVLLDVYLQILAAQDRDQELKWWISSKDRNSFFTSLVKLSSHNADGRAESILNKLVENTILFKETLIESSIAALIRSVKNVESDDVWNLLDESISRAMKTSYKYLDMAQKHNGVALFAVVIVEQFKFALDKSTNKPLLLSWLSNFLQNLVVIGEREQDLKELAQEYDVSLKFVSNNEDNDSFSSLILSSKLKSKLSALEKKRIISKYEFGLGLLRFIEEQDTQVIVAVFKMMCDYFLAVNDAALRNYVLNSPKFYEKTWKNKLKRDLINELLFATTNGKPTETYANKLVMKSQEVSGFAWVLTDKELKQLLQDQVVDDDLAIELVKRKISVDQQWFNNLDNKDIAAKLVAEGLVEFTNLDSKMVIDPSLIAAFITSPDASLREQALEYVTKNVTDPELMVYVASIVSELPETFSNEAEKHAFAMIDDPKNLTQWKQSLTVLNRRNVDTTRLLDAVAKQNDIYGFCPQFVEALKNRYSDSAEGRKWLHKCMLYITKVYAECSTIPESFDDFLLALKSALGSDLWRVVPTAIINTQLEVFGAHKEWVKHEKYLDFASRVIELGTSSMAYEKVLQIFITNQSMPLHELPNSANAKCRELCAEIISTLYSKGASKCATPLFQEQVLLLYLGTTRREDVLLKEVLKSVEGKLSQSWIDGVIEWELSETTSNDQKEYGLDEPRLITKGKSGLVVSLSKLFFQNTAHARQEPMIGSYNDSIYDLEFLLSIIINNDELVKVNGDEVKFDISKMVAAEVLPLLVMAMGYDNLRELAAPIVGGMVRSLNHEGDAKDAREANDAKDGKEAKDNRVYVIYLSNILYTLQQEYATKIPHLNWYIYAQFGQLLSNPGHFMYEPTYRFVLGHPKITSRDVPLFSLIAKAGATSSSDEEDNYYKQVSWLLQTIREGMVSSDDVMLVRNIGVIEWCLTLYQSPYASMRIKSLILELIARIQQIDQGIDVLVTRYAGLGWLESQIHPSANVFDEQLQLNLEKIMLRFGMGATKRVRDWANGDIDRVVKRVRGEASEKAS